MTSVRWERVKEIFHDAVECEADARAEFVRKSCGADEDLRREVESLLILDGESGSALDEPVVGAGAIAAAAPMPGYPMVNPTVGRTIGNYVITGELARGGMGIVYRAKHLALPRDVVVKCIHPLTYSQEARDELRKRFRREAYLQCQLDNPHIVRVYEFLEDAGEYFLVMEYVPGQSLRSMLDETGILTGEQATALAVQALEGLAHAHALPYVDEAGNNGQGIIHRDIKPANMLVDEHGNLKLTDFGIAQVLSTQLTQTGTNPGTVGYMSPEQIRGLKVDARSDLYSLGVALYEMLCGRMPFQRAGGGSDYDLLKAHIETDAPPIRTWNMSVPESLAAVVARSLMKEPDQRWQNAGEFRDALLLQSTGAMPLPAAPAGYGRRRRHTKLATWMLVAALATVLASTAFFWLRRGNGLFQPRADKTSIAVLPFADMSATKDQEYFSDGLAEELLNGLANTPGLRVVGRTSSFQFKDKTADFRLIGKKLNAATLLEGSVRKQGTRARITVQLINAEDGFNLWSQTYERDMNDIFAVEEEIAVAVTGVLQVKLLPARATAHSASNGSGDAYNAFLQGRYFLQRRNQANLEKALQYFQQAIQLDPRFARAWAGLAEVYNGQAGGGYVPAQQAFGAARVAADRALALDPNLADAYSALAWIKQFSDSDWTGADEAYKHALALDPGNAITVSHAGILARILGHLDQAVALGRRAMQMDPLSAGNCHNAGVAMYYAGLYEEATAAFRKALDLSPEMEVAHCFLGLVYLARSQPQDALAAMEKEKHPVLHLFGLALTHYALGQKKESDADLAEFIRQFPTASYQIAQIYAYRGEGDKAFGVLEKADQLAQLKGDPLMKNIAHDPRYNALLKKVRLPL